MARTKGKEAKPPIGFKKNVSKATKCTRAFSVVIVVAMVLAGFVASVNAKGRAPEEVMPDDQKDGTLLEEINSGLSDNWIFSFMQVSDLHIGDGYDEYGTSGYDDSAPSGDVGEAAQNLRTAVNWINKHKEEYKIKLIIVNGDLTGSAEKSEFYKAKEILDDLKVPYIPVFGNHDV